jgi:tetratricopeptide (TPR) repeat protein
VNRRLLYLIIASLIFGNNLYADDITEYEIIHLKTKAAELRSKSKFKEAIPILLRISEIYDSKKMDSEKLATALINIGVNYEDAGYYENATPFLKRAVDLRKDHLGADNYPTIRAINNLACNYVHLGDYESAIPLLKNCLEFKQGFLKPDDEDLVRAASNLANAYHNSGKFNEAFYYYEQSLELCSNLKENRDLISAVLITNLGHLYYDLGDYIKALQLFNRSLEIRLNQIGYYNKLTAQSYENKAYVLDRTGDLKMAIEAYNNSLEIYSNVFADGHSNIGNLYNSIGTLCLEVGDLTNDKSIYEEAISILNKSISTYTKYFSDEYLHASLPYYNMAIAYLEKDKDYKKALFYAKKSFDIKMNRLGKLHKNNLKNLFLLTKLYYLIDDKLNCSIYSQFAINCYNENSQNILILDEKSRDLYNNHNQGLFELIPCLDSNSIASLLINRKGIVNESFAIGNKLLEVAKNNEPLKDDLETIKHLKNMLQDFNGPNIDQSAYIRLNDTIAKLQRKIFRSNPNLTSYQHESYYSTCDVSRNLRGGSILIDFIQFNDIKQSGDESICLGALILSEDNSPTFVRINDSAAILKSVKALHAAISSNGADCDIEAETKFLSSKLWAPIASKIPSGSNHIFICPDANLNFLSFAALLENDGKFIAENYAITYIGSARDLVREPRSNFSKSVVIFADPQFDAKWNSHDKTSILNMGSSELEVFKAITLEPLPGSLSEAVSLQSIASSHGWIAQSFLGSNASEENLRKVKSPGVLHIATHGIYLESFNLSERKERRGMLLLPTTKTKNVLGGLNSVDPKRASWLALAGASQTILSWSLNKAPCPSNDGIFTADEANLLNLNDTWLVTLSACNSGLGKSISGEGIRGIRNSFAIAGARNLLISTTPVPDDLSSHFMKVFYKKALDKMDLSTSFSDTQREWLVNLRNKFGLSYSIANAGGYILYSSENEK